MEKGQITLHFKDNKIISYCFNGNEQIFNIPNNYQDPKFHKLVLNCGNEAQNELNGNKQFDVPNQILKLYQNQEFYKLVKLNYFNYHLKINQENEEKILELMRSQLKLDENQKMNTKKWLKINQLNKIKLRIPNFDSLKYDEKIWINKYEKECDYYQWFNDKSKVFHLKDYLDEIALKWYYKTLTECNDFDWENWKQVFINYFNDNPLLNYEKAINWHYTSGSLVTYFNEKYQLLEKGLPGVNMDIIILSVIHGLPKRIQNQIQLENIKSLIRLKQILQTIDLTNNSNLKQNETELKQNTRIATEDIINIKKFRDSNHSTHYNISKNNSKNNNKDDKTEQKQKMKMKTEEKRMDFIEPIISKENDDSQNIDKNEQKDDEVNPIRKVIKSVKPVVQKFELIKPENHLNISKITDEVELKNKLWNAFQQKDDKKIEEILKEVEQFNKQNNKNEEYENLKVIVLAEESCSNSENEKQEEIKDEIEANEESRNNENLNFDDYDAQLAFALQLSQFENQNQNELEFQMALVQSLNPIENIEEENINNEDNREDDSFECEICFDSFQKNESAVFNCMHMFCTECAKMHLTQLINDGSIDSLICPSSNCDELVSDELLEELVPIGVYQKFVNLRFEKTLTSLGDIVFCPKPNCGLPVQRVPDDLSAECQCGFMFCTNCLMPFHGYTDCGLTEEERQNEMLAYIKNEKQKIEQIEKLKEQRKKEEIDSERLVKEKCKKCPQCNANIEKNEGCNHMICTQCQVDFCWLCLTILPKLSKHSEQPHFMTGKCALFETYYSDEE